MAQQVVKGIGKLEYCEPKIKNAVHETFVIKDKDDPDKKSTYWKYNVKVRDLESGTLYEGIANAAQEEFKYKTGEKVKYEYHPNEKYDDHIKIKGRPKDEQGTGKGISPAEAYSIKKQVALEVSLEFLKFIPQEDLKVGLEIEMAEIFTDWLEGVGKNKHLSQAASNALRRAIQARINFGFELKPEPNEKFSSRIIRLAQSYFQFYLRPKGE